MNIGIFTDTYYPQINGVVTSTRMLEKELNKLGHKVYIFTTSDPNVTQALPRVFRLPSMPFVFLPSTRLAILYPPKLLLKLRILKLDIVHTQTEFPLGFLGKAVSEFFRIPLVHTYHTMYEDYVHYVGRGRLITPKMAQQYSRIFCNRAGVVIAPVEKTKESLLDYGVVRPIEVVPTGIDFEPFQKSRFSQEDIAETRQELGIAENEKAIVYVGRVAKEKGLDIVINQLPRFFEKMPNSRFVVVGPGPAIGDLTELAESLGISSRVTFAGPRPWDCIGKYYRAGDAFVTASTSETQGLTYIEAMASGVLVVAKKDRSTEGILSHGVTGYSFEQNDDLPDVLYKALTNTAEAAKMTENAFLAISHLSSIHFASSVENIYKLAISNKNTK